MIKVNQRVNYLRFIQKIALNGVLHNEPSLGILELLRFHKTY